MGEANEISEELGLDITYWVFNSAKGLIKCDKYKKNKFIKTVTPDEFMRELKSLRKRYIK